jgi:phosphoribosylglycinamide formyltransferase-1
MVDFYPRSIVNIHPSLLPSFGGKGMYGMHVHKAVYDANEVETGITIHYVNEHYDEGSIIAQHKVAIDGNDGPTDIARKVQDLEHEYFARSLARILN